MKYKAINEITHFSYHDAVIMSFTIKGNTMQWIVDDVNATTENSQNTLTEDMRILRCNIEFEDVQVDEIIFSAWSQFDEKWNLKKSEPARNVDPSEFTTILEETMKSWCRIQDLSVLPETNDRRYRISICLDGHVGIYNLNISYRTFIAQWDEYSGKAWYEEERWKNRKNEC
jgi:hypothetical protein